MKKLKSLIVRNQLDSDLKKRLSNIASKDKPVFEIKLDEIKKEIGASELSKYIDLTESIVALIDYLIREIDSFIMEFPKVAESNIELSKVNKAKL